MNIVTAAFPDRRFAEQAIEWVRSRGVPNENISVNQFQLCQHLNGLFGIDLKRRCVVSPIARHPASKSPP